MKLRLGLIGKDVSASHSGEIHAFILRSFGVSCEYRKVSVSKDGFKECALRLLDGTDGFNVTIPYKRDVMSLLTKIKSDAALCGAVNTVVCRERAGYNTDGAGFLLMLEEAGISVLNKTVLVLGAGGAGRSTAVALKEQGAKVFLYRRDLGALEAACKELGVAEGRADMRADIAINCTGVGMHESTGQSPVEKEAIAGYSVAVDLIYRPAESEFLRLAKGEGKQTLNGGAMLFYQAYFADCLYLGRQAEKEEATRLYQEFKRENGL